MSDVNFDTEHVYFKRNERFWYHANLSGACICKSMAHLDLARHLLQVFSSDHNKIYVLVARRSTVSGRKVKGRWFDPPQRHIFSF